MKELMVSPTLCPRGLIMQAIVMQAATCPVGPVVQVEIKTKRLMAQTQRRYYFREPVEFRRHLKADYFTGSRQEPVRQNPLGAML